ncbi:hypothetical protein REPUB_Repub09cG0131100 [Reevesia pubescens]
MAGVDYVEWDLDVEEWERDNELPPPHLLADDDEEEEEEEEFMKGQFVQNSCLSSYNNTEDDNGSERVTHELCYPEVDQWRSTIEKMWFFFMSIEKIVRTLIKLLMISWMERRVNNSS